MCIYRLHLGGRKDMVATESAGRGEIGISHSASLMYKQAPFSQDFSLTGHLAWIGRYLITWSMAEIRLK